MSHNSSIPALALTLHSEEENTGADTSIPKHHLQYPAFPCSGSFMLCSLASPPPINLPRRVSFNLKSGILLSAQRKQPPLREEKQTTPWRSGVLCRPQCCLKFNGTSRARASFGRSVKTCTHLPWKYPSCRLML